jgi:hypothetical protein
MVDSNIDIFEMSDEESVSNFKRLENSEKIIRTNGPGPATIPVDKWKYVSVTSSICKSLKNAKPSNMWCHYCEKNKHKKADFRAINEFKLQTRLALKPKLDPERILCLSMSFFEEIDALKGI